MEEARVVIDLKEGVIELQGPVDFVRHYLEMYQPSIKGLQIAPRKAAAVLEKPKRSTRRRSAKRPGMKRASCTAAIQTEIDAGFFNEPRSTGDVKQRLGEAGFSDSNIRNSLKRLTGAGVLNANGKGRGLTYSEPAP